MNPLKGVFLFIVVFLFAGFLQAGYSSIPTKVGMYYAIAGVLYGISEGLKQLPMAKKQEPGMVFLVLSTLRMFLFLIALLPLLLHREELNVTKPAALGLLFPLLITLLFETFQAIKALKDK
jgi:hypothetical protein